MKSVKKILTFENFPVATFSGNVQKAYECAFVKTIHDGLCTATSGNIQFMNDVVVTSEVQSSSTPPTPTPTSTTSTTTPTPTPVAAATTNPAVASTHNSLSATQQAALDKHNEYRMALQSGAVAGQPCATDMQSMTWDTKLASIAQAHADKCIWGHNAARSSDYGAAGGSGYVGENLGAGSGSYSYANAITSWWSEHSGYNYDTSACSNVCGHYTQMAWATSTQVGCGIKTCSTAQGLSWSSATIVVCNYSPGGNLIGKSPYETGTCPTTLLSSMVGSGSTTIEFDLSVPASGVTASLVENGADNVTPTSFVKDLQDVGTTTGFLTNTEIPQSTAVAVTAAPTSASCSDLRFGLQYAPLVLGTLALFSS